MTAYADFLSQLESLLSSGSIPEKDRDFASSLVAHAKSPRGLSVRQAPWVQRLVERALIASNPPASVTLDADRLYKLFDDAKKGLKFPKLKARTDGGRHLKLYVSGSRSRLPGLLNVVGEDDVYYGRLHRDGTWELSGRCSSEAAEDVFNLLVKLAADPEKTAAEYGHLVGNCCFCNIGLTDARSLEVGYGPVCARKWGLAWGAKRH